MHGHRPPFRQHAASGGRGRGRGQPAGRQPAPPPSSLQPPHPHLDPNFAFHNPNFYSNLSNALIQNLSGYFSFHQNPNFPIQNPSFPFQNTNIPPHQFSTNFPQQQNHHNPVSQQQQPQELNKQQAQSANPQCQKQVEEKGKETLHGPEKKAHLVSPQKAQNLPPQISEETKQKGKEKEPLEGAQKQSQKSVQQQAQKLPIQIPKQVKYLSKNSKYINSEQQELLEKVDRAVEKAWGDLLAAGESVSAWKVSQAALVILQVDSWDSLGFRMQEVPSLHRLILVEGKINAFIHCFVGVRRFTSLYDLELAICENEGIEQFEELELGPLLRHSLVMHYFSVDRDATEVAKITTEDIILHLNEYMSTFSKNEIVIDEFLDFIAKKQSFKGKRNLGVRIQSLGMHISFIREARRSKHTTLKKCQKILEKKSEATILRNSTKGSGYKYQKHPLFSSQKKDLDERFSAISQRIESFASVQNDFCGKHTRFDSSSSEDEESDSCSHEDKMNSDDQSQFSLQNVNTTDKVSSCPYPSASEEISRLGLKGDMVSQASPVGSSSTSRRRLHGNKRKIADVGCTGSPPAKLLKGETGKHNMHAMDNGNKTEDAFKISGAGISLPSNSIKMFITTWREACKEHTVAEVLDKMAQFYKPGDDRAARDRRRMKRFFSSNPWIGLLNVAVTAIKSGMLDSIYDTFQTITQLELPIPSSEYESIDVEPREKHTEYESNVVEPGEKHTPVSPDCELLQTHNVTVEAILGKISEYYDLDHKFQSHGKSLLEDKLMSMKGLLNCESWLVDQFGIKEFKSLGHGEFFTFLEKNASLMPTKLKKLFAFDKCEKPPVEVSVVQNQLIALVSQAATNLWENETISKQMISALFAKQFPLLSFKIIENVSMEVFLKTIGEYKNDAIAKRVMFSATLLGKEFTGDALKGDQKVETAAIRINSGQKSAAFESITSKNVVEVLVKAPMLSDLNSWSHWDLIFSPSLGPLVGWLLSELNAKELCCLVTKDGKVIRINQSANADTFLEAALQGSSFRTAVELLSLLSLAGGEKHVPMLLLKSYALHAFDVILKNHFENIEVVDNKNYLSCGKVPDGVPNCSIGKSQKILIQTNQRVPAACRFILDCLSYLPSEFHSFAADVLLSGMQSVIKDAPYAILCECNQDERIMLHEIGLSIGIAEWVDDYCTFYSSGNTDFDTSSGRSAHLEAARPGLATGSSSMKIAIDMYSCGDGVTNLSLEEDVHNDENAETIPTNQDAVMSSNGIDHGCAEECSEIKKKDAALVIESIRRDEFGLDPNLSCTESTMLKKQHARLGRALHCLSQELYSEDSHFLLELVQNADDNIYPESVEPTITFILQESSIIVLNNEQGFSEKNVRALCDVGNSTKKGSGAGYIGQKGIGFKSVFRVTDAPEIHSNGFHIKFDISEGQIGFVLPTVVPPCNVDLYSTLVSGETGQMVKNCWNTCIRLPFRSKLSEETALKMFSDLHPSLLLFLHRLQCIMFRNMLDDSLLVMKKEILQDGIIKVSCGKDKMTWLVASQKLQAHASRPKVQTTEIAIAFTLEESDNGDYYPHLELQPVFAFLPLRTYGLKFILQGDFILPSSREEVDKNDPWNEWLLSKFPGLFVNAERSFCALSCFRGNPGRAVAAYMSFVPLVGEVHGFFSGLPKAIALELRRTSCLLLEGDKRKMVPPCNVLRGWNEQAHKLLPDGLLQEHLGLGFLDNDIVLSDSLARALGIAEYGPEILIKFITCLCRTKSDLKSMGLDWLSSFLNALYTMLPQSSGPTDIIDNLQHIPFIPLSDGTYSSVGEGTIWLHSDILSDGAQELEAFPQLYARLRIVNPALFSAAVDGTLADNSTMMLQIIGVQQLSAHEIMRVHILPAIFNDELLTRDKGMITDYLCFLMIHLQSSCPHCSVERKNIITELQNKAYILTNLGYKRLNDTSIHFSKEYGNPININKLIDVADMKWHVVDMTYLNHPVNDSLSNGLMKWREFFQEIGVTDFVQVVQIDKSISDLYHTVLKNSTLDTELISARAVVKDWESYELVQILSLLCHNGDREQCKYFMEVLDTLWDDNFSDKTTGYCSSKSSVDGRTIKSSFLSSIHDVQWVVSSMDDKLHYPKDLFHDCDAVRSVLGGFAPYAIPKVRSTKLLSDIGFKTKVTLNDALEILRAWKESDKPFKASIAQMSKLYSFIWDEMAASRKQVSEALHSVPYIFVPCEIGSRHEDLVSGVFLSVEEVYWHDPTGSVDLMKEIHSQHGLTSVPQRPLIRALCNVYAGLHDFFVKECGVHEIPSCCGYFDILYQLATVALPSQAGGMVLQIFLKWTDGLTSGLLRSEEIIHIRDCLVRVEYAVLPTVLDRWVSLHPSFGLVCWCDDKNLKKIFKDMDNIDFLYFGNLSDHEEDVLRTKISDLMKDLGIPALSGIINREAIYYGPADCSFKASLIDWVLPYAQRYIYGVHPDKYLQLKQSEFNSIKQLKITVVEKLFYRNVIKNCDIASTKRYECSCLLEGYTLYTTSESDLHALFLELSRLFFDGVSNLHLANFLHMITTMVESGSTEDQTELFVLNSQKVPKVPDDEPVWSLSSLSSLVENDESLQMGVELMAKDKQMMSKSKKKVGTSSGWPPADWKTAPGFEYAWANGFKTQAVVSHPSFSGNNEDDDLGDIDMQIDTSLPIEIDSNCIIEENAEGSSLLDSENVENHFAPTCSKSLETDTRGSPVDLPIMPGSDEPSLIVSSEHEPSSRFGWRERLNTGTANASQVLHTGKLGERVAFKYLAQKFSGRVVRWVNEDSETGLPYDIVVGEGEWSKYFEVKATKYAKKDWFNITMREWQFAIEKGRTFSIAHVVLHRNNTATVTIFQNLAKLCQKGNLQLAVIMPR